jgi:hypothetical protein
MAHSCNVDGILVFQYKQFSKQRDQISRSIRTLEFAGPNLDLLTGYTDCGSSWFFSDIPVEWSDKI